MATEPTTEPTTERPAARPRLNRDRVIREAIVHADRDGVDALSMRSLAAELGVAPMALYKHVAHKEELLDAIVGALVAEIEVAPAGPDWRDAVRRTVLSARAMLLRHPWARRVLETRTAMTPPVVGYLDAVSGLLLAGGLDPVLAHHAMHALGSRVWGFTQELFDTPAPPPAPEPAAALAAAFPNLVVVAAASAHTADAVGRSGCDDRAEFLFALDTLLDGVEAKRIAGWTPANGTGSAPWQRSRSDAVHLTGLPG